MIYKIFILIILGFSTIASAKSIIDQINEDDLKVVIDYSAIINKQLITENICHTNYTPTKFNKDGIPVKMLGYANVYMGTGPGISRYGHLGERFVYCIGSELHDMYYDGIKLRKETLPLFHNDYPEASLDYASSNKVLNSLYYRKIQNPTQISVYGNDTVRSNRNIYEQWLKISEKEMLDLLVRNINRVAKQALQISNEENLAPFRGLLNNCTYEVTDDLRSIPTLQSIKIEISNPDESGPFVAKDYILLSDSVKSISPRWVYNALTEGHVTKLLVIYPSQDNVRKIFFNKVSFHQSLKILEVHDFNFNPKFAKDWNETELKKLNSLIDYKSPLASFFEREVADKNESE